MQEAVDHSHLLLSVIRGAAVGADFVSVCRDDRDVIDSQRSHLSLSSVSRSVIDPRTFGKVEPINAEWNTAMDCDNGGDGGVGMDVVHKKRLSAAQRKKSRTKPIDVKPDLSRDAALRRALDQRALLGYESFYRLPPGTAVLEQVVKSSAGVTGWANFAACLDVVRADVDADRQRLDQQLQREKLLEDLGVIDEVKKQVRFGVDHSVNIFEVSEPIGTGDAEVLSSETWQDVEFEVALDSYSQDHVCDEVDTPGYSTVASPGSSRGQCFIVGDGGKLANMGQRHLNM